MPPSAIARRDVELRQVAARRELELERAAPLALSAGRILQRRESAVGTTITGGGLGAFGVGVGTAGAYSSIESDCAQTGQSHILPVAFESALRELFGIATDIVEPTAASRSWTR